MMELTRLPSGLTVVTDAMPHVDSLALGVWVEAGAASEREDEHGAAHFLEHMAFKGTHKRTARQISEAIEDVGGEINAATSIETTAYHTRLLAQDLPLGLDILADILTDPLFAPDDVTRECNVILQEIGAAADNPEERAFDAFPETAFSAQPFGRRILGTRESVPRLNRQRLGDFFRRHYQADVMTVVAAGAIDHDRFVADVERNFGAVTKGTGEAPAPANYRGGVHSEDCDSAECHWLLGFEGHRAGTAEASAAQLAAMVLGGGMSSRLFQALREDRGLVYDTSAFHWAFARAGLFAIHLATEGQSVEEAAGVVADELVALCERVPQDELDRARAQLRAGLLMSRESCASRMGQAARNALVYGRPVSKEERIAELEAISTHDVRAAFEAILTSPPTLVSVGAPAGPSRDLLSKRLPLGELRGAA